MSLVGSTIRHIRLQALLGVGGMGEVYRGLDEKLQRPVAVKTIRAEHRLAGDAKARFLREARILSKLAHPAICQVYDLIETADADFLVLELVEGANLDEVAAEGRLAERDVLELGARIAEALAVAHRERIVHRDLKPANVMVTPGGGVKILDFGIARAATEAELEPRPSIARGPAADPAPADAERTHYLPAEPPAASGEISGALTEHGQILGTVRYMSPEQAAGEDLTGASDLFSFGIVLQELLTGRPAYDEGLTIAELLRRVIEHESLPMTGVDPEVARLVEDLKHPVPARRPTAEEALARLRWILGKPQRRRRRRLRLAAAAAAFALLSIVLVVVAVLGLRAERARVRAEDLAGRLEIEAARANREAKTARRVVGFLVELFEEADPDQARGREVTVRDVVARGSARIGAELTQEPLVQANLQNALGTISWRLGDYDTAVALLERALATLEREPGTDDTALAEVLSRLGAVEADRQRFAEAKAALDRARALLEAQPAPPPDDLAFTLNSLGAVALRQGESAESEALFARALELRRAAPQPDQREISGTLNNLAVLAWQRADFVAAEGYYRQALDIDERRLGADDPRLAAPLNNMGILLRDQGRYEESEALHRRALAIAEHSLGPHHPDVGSILASLARLYGRQERLEEGIALLERSLAIARAALGADHPDTGTTLVRLGDLERRAGRLARAERLTESGLATLAAALGADHPRLLEAHTALGRLRHDQHRDRQAAASLREAERIGAAALGPDHPDVVALRAELAALSQPIPAAVY